MLNRLHIPPWPVIEEDEQQAVLQVLRSGKTNYWGGDQGIQFEQEFALWCGATFGLCVFNGTVALELALRSVGIEQGDEVIVSPRSFLASAASVVAVGGVPVFADVDLESGNLTAQTIRQAITPQTKGIVVVHLGGWPANMPAIMELAAQHNLKVIEDCAQAHGASVEGKRTGSFGHAAAFSFCQDKIMSTGGEGGMVLTSDERVRDIAWSLRDHGRNREKTLSDDHPFGFRWLQERFGTNGRMTEMQAAIGRCQLGKVEGWLSQRQENANTLTHALQEIEGIKVPLPPNNINHAFYRFNAICKDKKYRDELVRHMQTRGIPAAVGPCPEIYLEKPFIESNVEYPVQLPVAADLGERSMVLPVHPGMETVLGSIIDQIATTCA